jgi:hypothetical protein
VLRAVKRLAEEARRAPAAGAAKTLSDLALPGAFREVVDKDADAVLDEIEAAVYEVRWVVCVVVGDGW